MGRRAGRHRPAPYPPTVTALRVVVFGTLLAPLAASGSDCGTALASACRLQRNESVFACAECAGAHQRELVRAGCSNDDIASWCAGGDPAPSVTWRPRDVQIKQGAFVDRRTGRTVVMNGTNVVMKGPPWIPSVNATVPCGADSACSTFSDADAIYLKSKGWNLIRLGVVWAGGQPTAEPALDAAWVSRLHAVLEMCERHELRVILDIHQDAVGTAMCGEGVPMWYSQRHFPELIGAKTPAYLLRHFARTKHDHFNKTGSGQT